jgi:hypothetical protein
MYLIRHIICIKYLENNLIWLSQVSAPTSSVATTANTGMIITEDGDIIIAPVGGSADRETDPPTGREIHREPESPKPEKATGVNMERIFWRFATTATQVGGLAGSIQRTFREHTGKTFSVHSVNIWRTLLFRGYDWADSGVFFCSGAVIVRTVGSFLLRGCDCPNSGVYSN